MMNADFLDALGQIEKEKDIPREHLLEMIASALSSAYKKTYNETARIRLRPDPRGRGLREVSDRVGEVVTGVIQRREQRNAFVLLGKVEALLPYSEQVPGEPYRFNDRLRVYILEVKRTTKGPQVIVSRSHPSLIRRLFELEVPEIADGIVTIRSVAREPGARSKIAVASSETKVDPVGACVGHRGSRVQAVVTELYGEKIDIIRWSDSPADFITEA